MKKFKFTAHFFGGSEKVVSFEATSEEAAKRYKNIYSAENFCTLCTEVHAE